VRFWAHQIPGTRIPAHYPGERCRSLAVREGDRLFLAPIRRPCRKQPTVSDNEFSWLIAMNLGHALLAFLVVAVLRARLRTKWGLADRLAFAAGASLLANAVLAAVLVGCEFHRSIALGIATPGQVIFPFGLLTAYFCGVFSVLNFAGFTVGAIAGCLIFPKRDAGSADVRRTTAA
jgi:hypothetical protein